MHRLIACAAALTLAFSATSAAACAAPEGASAMASEIAAGLNSSRRANGLAPLDFDRRLGSAAQAHACDMARNGIQTHVGSDGSTARMRTRRAGHDDCYVGESLAWGFRNAGEIVPRWMNSPGHRQVLMLERVDHFGIGITEGPKGPNWVLVVARDC